MPETEASFEVAKLTVSALLIRKVQVKSLQVPTCAAVVVFPPRKSIHLKMAAEQPPQQTGTPFHIIVVSDMSHHVHPRD